MRMCTKISRIAASIVVLAAIASCSAGANNTAAKATPTPTKTAPEIAIATTCGYPYPAWNTSAKDATSVAQGPITDIDAAKHECFDRIVVRRVAGETWPGYDIRYVTQASTEAAGCPANLGTGNKVLRVSVTSPDHTTYGVATTANKLKVNTEPGSCDNSATPLRTWKDDLHVDSAELNFTEFNSVRQAKWLGSQHETSSFALGIAGKKTFKVWLANKNRDLVIDIAK